LARFFSGFGFAFQWPSPLPRVNNVVRHRSFLCRSCSGCFSWPSANRRHGPLRGVSLGLNLAVCPSAASAPPGLCTPLVPTQRRAARPRAASALASSLHLHVWLHWLRLFCSPQNKRGSVSHARQASVTVFRPRPFKLPAFVRLANWSFNADNNAMHYCRLTLALCLSAFGLLSLCLS